MSDQNHSCEFDAIEKNSESGIELSEKEEYAQLVYEGPTGETSVKNILRPTTLLGSAVGCNVRLLSSTVAPSHAVITYDDREFRIWDLRSTTGTFVNEQKVIHARLNHNDEIDIGKFKFRLDTNLSTRARKGFFIDDYRVLNILGTGGMGWLYAVEHHRTGQKLALKVLTRKGDRKGVNENELRVRFWFEGKAGKQAIHPNIVRALGYQCRGDVDYIVMDLIESITLQELIERDGKLDPRLACSVVSQVAHALEYIHEQGPIHRDIKPANVLIEKSGDVKLCDFGLVYLGDDPREERIAKQMAGDCLGTADFISPEQSYDSYNIDGRADLYSLGCTLYLALSGKMPFPGKTAREKLDGHRNHAPPALATLVSGLPEGLYQLVEKAMEKDPEKRFRSASEMIQALEPFLQKQPVQFDFDQLLKKRTEQARLRLLDPNRTHYLDRIPPNIVAGTLGMAVPEKKKPVTTEKKPPGDSSKNFTVVEPQNAMPETPFPPELHPTASLKTFLQIYKHSCKIGIRFLNLFGSKFKASFRKWKTPHRTSHFLD